MFNLDKQIISFIYNQCKSVGSAFGYGALEGFIIYSGLIISGVLSILKDNKK